MKRRCSGIAANGEPLVQRGIMTLVNSVSRYSRAGDVDELTLTTNGWQLQKYSRDLVAAAARRVNVSLYTLDAEGFRAITRRASLDRMLAGIDAVQAAGPNVKINVVALKEVNDDEFPRLIEWAHGRGYGFDADRGHADAAYLRKPLRASDANDLLSAAIDEAIGRKPKGNDFIIIRPPSSASGNRPPYQRDGGGG